MTGTSSTTCDVLVIGAGAGGLAAAITARHAGLDVIVIEKEPVFGGTSALSGGWVWIPCSAHAQRAGVVDSIADARAYLQHETGSRFDAQRVDAYLANGPSMIDFFERETSVKFMLGPTYPDYHPDLPGGTSSGRALCAIPIDGHALGADLAHLRRPVREMTLYGLKVGSGPDFHHFFNARRSLRSALYVAKRILRHVIDITRHGRDMLLMSGNALVARLARSAMDLEIPIWLDTPALELMANDGRVTGAIVERNGHRMPVIARRGVVCATGGFARDLERRRKLFAHAPDAAGHFSLTAPGSTGDGLRLAEAVGAMVEDAYASAAPWMPVSRVPYRDGSVGTYPHSYDRGKPGVIAVTQQGIRFVNESDSYHDFVQAMIASTRGAAACCAYLIADHRFVQSYGLGMAKPFPLPLRPYVRSGYLKRAATIRELAASIGIDAGALEATVAQFNAGAARGDDPLYQRGHNAYNRYQGDARHTPNACLAPIVTPPFYAVKVLPGDLGTFMGLRTNAVGAVLDGNGAAIEGLFAIGNDMASIFAGTYPGPGSNLGPAMTFGYICARFLAEPQPVR